MSDFYGPALPPGFAAAQPEEDTTTEHEPTVSEPTTVVHGPQLPTERKLEEGSGAYGPALPQGLLARGSDETREDEAYGPLFPSDRDVTESPQQHQKIGKTTLHAHDAFVLPSAPC